MVMYELSNAQNHRQYEHICYNKNVYSTIHIGYLVKLTILFVKLTKSL